VADYLFSKEVRQDEPFIFFARQWLPQPADFDQTILAEKSRPAGPDEAFIHSVPYHLL
jgi:hypothetical protein